SYGHPGGDVVLCELSQRIARSVRTFDLVARYGGEEFVVGMPETPLAVAAVVAERLRHALAAEPFGSPDLPKAGPVPLGMGVAATLPGGNDPAAALLKRGDDALYGAKRRGRNRVLSPRDGAGAPEPVSALRAMG